MTTDTSRPPSNGRSDADLEAAGMRPWSPDIETMFSIVDPLPIDDDTNQLLGNAIEPDATYEHPRAAELVREFAHQLAIHADRISYLGIPAIEYHAKAAAAMLKNAGLQERYLGEVVTADQVMAFLSLTRGQLAQLRWDGDLISVRDVWKTVDLFPLWQFDIGEARIRREVAILTTAYRGTMYDGDKLMLLGWISERQAGLLPGDVSVVEWIETHGDSGEDLNTVRTAIARGARELRAIEQQLS